MVAERYNVPVYMQSARTMGNKLYSSELDICIRVGQVGLLGGKGGFGSVVRQRNNPSKKYTPVTNFDSCRRLDGRRVAHARDEGNRASTDAERNERERLTRQGEQFAREAEMQHAEAAIFSRIQADSERVAQHVSSAVMAGLRRRKQENEKEEEEEIEKDDHDVDDEKDDHDVDDDRSASNVNRKREREQDDDEEESAKRQRSNKSDLDELRTIDLNRFESADALVGDATLEALKEELVRLGLKCGGTLAQRAGRLFATKGKQRDQLHRNMFARK
jgi:replication stress response regulator SDE2